MISHEFTAYTTPPLDFTSKMEVASCYCTCEGRLLLLQGAEHKPYGGYWGAPGGKLDPDEAPLHAALRETQEETGICLTSAHFFKIFFIRYPSFDFTYHVYYIELPSMPAKILLEPKEHIAYLWVNPQEIQALPLLPGAYLCYRELYGEPLSFQAPNS